MAYSLGINSQKNLDGVKPNLVEVVQRAIKITKVDFSVLDGVRAIEEQLEFVRTGASHTMRSYHLLQDDGFGHAVDLVPYIAGKSRWEMAPCCKIADAIRQAADELDVNVKWGGCWSILTGSTPWQTEIMVGQYISRKLLADKGFFLDGPHYELLEGG